MTIQKTKSEHPSRSSYIEALPSFWNFEGAIAVSEDPIAIFSKGFAAKFGDECLGIREAAFFDEPFEMHFRAMIKKAHPRVLLFVLGKRILFYEVPDQRGGNGEHGDGKNKLVHRVTDHDLHDRDHQGRSEEEGHPSFLPVHSIVIAARSPGKILRLVLDPMFEHQVEALPIQGVSSGAFAGIRFRHRTSYGVSNPLEFAFLFTQIIIV